MFDPRPLCCSSLTTAVGGTKDTNFVDSAHPTVARINQYEKQAYGTLTNNLRKTPRRLTKFNMKMKRIDDLHTHTEQDLKNKQFKYISLSRIL